MDWPDPDPLDYPSDNHYLPVRGPGNFVGILHYSGHFDLQLQVICNENRAVKQRHDFFMRVKPAIDISLWPTLLHYFGFNNKSDLLYDILRDNPDAWIPNAVAQEEQGQEAARRPESREDLLATEVVDLRYRLDAAEILIATLKSVIYSRAE